MTLLSSIIEEFEESFLDKYKNSIMSRHKKALQAMKQCRKEHGPHMLAKCTAYNCGAIPIFLTPAATGAVPIARTMKAGSGSKTS